MKKNKRISKLFCFIVGLPFLVFNVNIAYADGGLIAPPYKSVYETDQKAVVFYDEGYENLILSISFQGNTDDFAWIVPTPSRPEVEKSVDSLFTKLDEITKPEEVYYPANERNSLGFGYLGATDKGVTVVETKKVDYYDINVLESTDSGALYNWLNDNGYNFPQAGKYIADDYIKKGWYFTAIKINNNDLSNLTSGQLKSGHAIPLKLKFKTDQIVYPLKISSLAEIEDNAPAGQVTYIDGFEGKAVQVDSDRVLATDNVIKNFNVKNGKISFYLKKRDNNSLGEIIKIEKAKSYLGKQQGISIADYNNRIQFNYAGDYLGQYEVQLGSDFKQNQWQKYEFEWIEDNNSAEKHNIKFYIDGIGRSVEKKYLNTVKTDIKKSEINDFAKIIIGGQESYVTNEEIRNYNIRKYNENGQMEIQIPPSPPLNYFSGRNNDLSLDQIALNSDLNLIFKAGFENNLSVGLVNGGTDLMRIFNKNSNVINRNQGINRPSSMGILLYVFAEKEQEITGFDIQYAGRVEKEDIKNIAMIEGTTPWINPSQDKYYLTRLYRKMNISEMTEDLYPQENKNSSPFNSPTSSEGGRRMLLYILLAVSILSVVAIILAAMRKEKSKI